MPDEPINDNPQPEPTPHFDAYAGNNRSASSFDMNQTPKPEPTAPAEPQIQPVPESSQPLPVGQGPMKTAFSPKPSVPDEMSRIPDGHQDELVEPVVAPSKPKWYKTKKFIIAIIAVVIIIVLAGGSVLAYTAYQNPQKVITDSIAHAITAKSAIYTGNLNIGNDELKVDLMISGKNNNAEGEFDGKLKITVDGKSYSVDGSVIYDDNGDLYFKVGGLKAIATDIKTSMGIAQSSAMAVSIDKLVIKIDNVWIKISSDDLKKYSDEAATTKNCFSDTIDKYKDDKDAINEFTGLYNDNQFIVVEKELGIKDGNLGYEIKISNEKLKGYLDDAKQTKFYKSLQECDKTLTLDTADIPTEDQTNGKYTMKIWSNMWTHQLARFEGSASDEGTTANFAVSTKFNQSVTIDAPNTSISLSELQSYIQELFTSFSSTGEM